MKTKGKDTLFGIALLAPAMIILALLFVKPAIDLVSTSLTNQNLMRPDRLDFIGAENYAWMLEGDVFWGAMGRSLVFTLCVTAISIAVSMVIALLLNLEFPWRRVLFALLLLPWVTSYMASAFIYTLLYDYSWGVFNYILGLFGVPAQNWLGQVDTAMGAVILVTVWHFLPFSILVLTNAIKQVSQELLESARIDGANSFRAFFSITLPIIRPPLITLQIVRVAATFKTFDSIYLLTRGGPGDATTTLPMWYYQVGFQSFRTGRGAAIGVVLVLTVLVIQLVMIRIFGEDAV